MTSKFLLQRSSRRLSRGLSERVQSWWAQAYLRQAGVPHAGRIRSFTTPQELQALFQIAAFECPTQSVALEIGSYLGASTCYLAAGLAVHGGKLFCVDTWKNETMPDGVRDTFALFRKNTRGVSQIITTIRSQSQEIVAEQLTLPLQLAFLDGDHSYQAVKADFELVSPWIADNGIIAFHDCLYFEGVSRVIGETLMTGKWVIAGQVGNLFWIKKAKFPYAD